MKALVKKIKEKKELSGLADQFVLSLVKDYLNRNKINLSKLSKKDEKALVKELRKDLRKYSGRFQVKKSSELLDSHLSTLERKSDYPFLKKKIYSFKPKSILDLGCGLNPLALAKPSVEYYASDIREDHLKTVRSFFKKKKISGKVFFQDLKKSDSFVKTDLTLLFKVLDIIENKGHKLAESIVKRIKSPRIIISFPKNTISGKPMKQPRRYWLEKMLSRLNYKFSIIELKNEIFYLVIKEGF